MGSGSAGVGGQLPLLNLRACSAGPVGAAGTIGLAALVALLAAPGAVVAGWQRSDLLGLRLGGLTAEEALALERPAMTLVRGQLGDRPAASSPGRIGGGCIPPADVGPATASCRGGHPQTAAVSALETSHPDDIARRAQFHNHIGHLTVSAGGGRCPPPQSAGGCTWMVGYRRPRYPRPA
jgi:hypothetical protein